MALTGFLVPFASGALIKRQEIADEYDETAGEIIDAASEKYNLKFDQNQSQIELQNANFAAVEASLGTAVAEVAAKNGLLNNIKTALVLKNVKDNLTEKYIKHIQRVTKNKDLKNSLGYQSLFSDDYKRATSELKGQRDWAANNLNKGAIKNVTDLYLGKEDEEPTKIEKTQEFLFGPKITKDTGFVFSQAASEKIGDPITVQPSKVPTSSISLAERLGYTDAVFIGTLREQDTALANILSMDGATITNEGIAFPAANKNHANAIKFLAATLTNDEGQLLADKWTTSDGKVDTSNLFTEANNYILENIISKFPGMFVDYGVPKGQQISKMSERIMHAAGGFNEKWLEANGLSSKDVQPYVLTGKTKTTDRTLGKFTITNNVYEVISDTVETLSPELQKVYIDYLPNNILYKDSNKTVKERLRAEFGLKQFV